ncbi:hypothetical protein DYB32_001876 [Aphanomyces invadans]|uniref:RING-type E3 ubiquitin transferase n=1 Tax=Aphanomyces invadans TaxID=157072 RepID=A0A418B7S0_9STRA|nr:hypothetical protein DYB32_001876 [Aphanomyces invadans]
MLYDHARFAIAETCFTLSVFREEMSLRVLGLFTILLFLKTFHWLFVSRITHVRLVLLMALLAAVDMIFVIVSGLQVAERGPSVLVLFGFEFLILFVTLVAVFLRYILHLIDARVEGTWTNKFTYVFYLELVTEIVKLIVYLNLQRRIVAYFRYRRITANMNERFPNPTEEEMNETDRICIICREEMTLETAKKLPCTHIFHLNCLRMWLQRQQVNACVDVNCASTHPHRKDKLKSKTIHPFNQKHLHPHSPKRSRPVVKIPNATSQGLDNHLRSYNKLQLPLRLLLHPCNRPLLRLHKAFRQLELMFHHMELHRRTPRIQD